MNLSTMSNSSSKPNWLFGQYRYLLLPLVATVILASAILWRTMNPSEPAAVAPLAPIELAAPAAVTQFEARLQRNPEDVQAYALLGQALLQQVRLTGDSSLYMRADEAFEEALTRDPANLDALVGKGILAAALHDFEAAIDWAEEARTLNPWRAETLGILVDAYVELGRYDEAVATTQEMVDLKPGLDSYSRVSYIRELHGDVDGAVQAMQAAVDAGVPGTEPVLWSQVQLANLYLSQGDLAEAEALYRAALDARPNYLYAQAGLAKLAIEQEDYATAIETLEAVTTQLPLPEFIISLAEAYDQTGQTDKAAIQLDLVRTMQKLSEAAGMNLDLELAAFEVEYGSDPAVGLTLAQDAYDRQPTIFAADTLAWALYKNGRYPEAKEFSDEALRLGTQAPLLLEHAAEIEAALIEAE